MWPPISSHFCPLLSASHHACDTPWEKKKPVAPTIVIFIFPHANLRLHPFSYRKPILILEGIHSIWKIYVLRACVFLSVSLLVLIVSVFMISSEKWQTTLYGRSCVFRSFFSYFHFSNITEPKKTAYESVCNCHYLHQWKNHSNDGSFHSLLVTLMKDVPWSPIAFSLSVCDQFPFGRKENIWWIGNPIQTCVKILRNERRPISFWLLMSKVN